MYQIEVEGGKKIKCPNCNSIFAIQNDKEILYRNITLLYFGPDGNKAKCKQCKGMIDIEV